VDSFYSRYKEAELNMGENSCMTDAFQNIGSHVC